MTLRLPLLVTLILAGPAAFAESLLDRYVTWRTGTFTSGIQASQDSRYDAITWHIAAAPGDSNTRSLYVESWMPEADAPYMQRIIKVSEQGDGTLKEDRYLLRSPGNWLNAWQRPEKLAELEDSDLILAEGCTMTWVPAGTDSFEGSTAGRDCISNYKGSSYALSHGSVRADGFSNWDRGFANDGALVWGPASGPYRFTREDQPPACAKPVYMLVHGNVTDRDKIVEYARAIFREELYPEVDGYYIAMSPVLDVFEGEPPPGRAVIIARFPCEEAAKSFWTSDKYNEVRKIREGAADFEVLLLPGVPVPGWVTERIGG